MQRTFNFQYDVRIGARGGESLGYVYNITFKQGEYTLLAFSERKRFKPGEHLVMRDALRRFT